MTASAAVVFTGNFTTSIYNMKLAKLSMFQPRLERPPGRQLRPQRSGVRHMPPAQPPPSLTRVMAGVQESSCPLPGAAKVESCCSRWLCPQEGHRTSSEAGRRTSFSNLVPQSSHKYSKIGIALLYKSQRDLINPGLDLSGRRGEVVYKD